MTGQRTPGGTVPLSAPYYGAGLPIAFGRYWRKYATFSGLFWLFGFIPSVGGIILLVLTLLPSKPEGARFDAPAV